MIHTKCREIGTSKGVIIPRHILENAHITVNDDLEIDFYEEDNTIRIKKSVLQQPRLGWALAFKKLHKAEEDQLLIPDVFEDECIDESI